MCPEGVKPTYWNYAFMLYIETANIEIREHLILCHTLM
jgi:hypothetical protein